MSDPVHFAPTAWRLVAALQPKEINMPGIDPACTWCHHGTGHVEADHPLPRDHPDYDAFYDASDAELGGMVHDALDRQGWQ